MVHGYFMENIMRVAIKGMTGKRCIVREDGQRVYDTIHNALKQGESVVLDFEGVSQFASPFFNSAIGQLLKDMNEDDLQRLLQIENLNANGKLVVERVIENAARYYGDVDYRKIVDQILEQQARDSA